MYEDGKVIVRAEDLQASIDFYVEKLGFEMESLIEGRWAEIKAPGLTIVLFQRLPHQPDLNTGPMGVGVGLWVADVEKSKAEMEARGVLFEGEVVDLHLLRVSFLSDPSGHQLMLCQVREDTPVSTD